MVSFTDPWKIAKFETEANDYFINRFGLEIAAIGSRELTNVSFKILSQMKLEKSVNQERYNELLLEKFYQVGLLVAAPANPLPGD